MPPPRWFLEHYCVYSWRKLANETSGRKRRSFSRPNKKSTAVLNLDETTRIGVAGILYTVTDIDSGWTAEQERFLGASARHVIRVPSNEIESGEVNRVLNC